MNKVISEQLSQTVSANDYKLSLSADFEMVSSSLKLRIEIEREVISHEAFLSPLPTCSISFWLRSKHSADRNELPDVRFTRHVNQSMHSVLEQVYFVIDTSMLSVLFSGCEVKNIHVKERSRLAALLSELRGIDLIVQDLDAFYRRDGAKKEERSRYPFPELVA